MCDNTASAINASHSPAIIMTGAMPLIENALDVMEKTWGCQPFHYLNRHLEALRAHQLLLPCQVFVASDKGRDEPPQGQIKPGTQYQLRDTLNIAVCFAEDTRRRLMPSKPLNSNLIILNDPKTPAKRY